MRKKHSIRITIPYLFGTNENILFSRINIQKQLSGVDYLINGMNRVLASDKRKKCDCIKHKKERTGHSEKITHHQVCCPCGLQFRKAVKNIKSIPAFSFNRIMYLHSEVFKAMRKRYLNSFYLRYICNERLVCCEPEIDCLSLILDRLSDIRLHK